MAINFRKYKAFIRFPKTVVQSPRLLFPLQLRADGRYAAEHQKQQGAGLVVERGEKNARLQACSIDGRNGQGNQIVVGSESARDRHQGRKASHGRNVEGIGEIQML